MRSPSPSRSPLSTQHLTDEPLTSSETGTYSIRASSSQRALQDSFLPVLPFQPSFDDIALSYFTNELKTRDSERIQLLVQVAHDFVQTSILSRSSYDQLWSTKSDIFNQSEIEHTSRIRRLHKSLRKIKQGSKEYDCAKRFALLFLRQKFDEIVASVENTELSYEQKKATVAYKRIALDLFTTVTALKDERRRSRLYLFLLTKFGPSDLLKLDDDVSSLWAMSIWLVCSNNWLFMFSTRWERRLLDDDIDLLIRFRKENFPKVDEIFRDLDFLSTRTLLHGLVAYDWTYKELSECRSDLITQLVKYVDPKQLAHGQVQAFGREPYRKRRRLEQNSTSLELSTRSDFDRPHQNSEGLNPTNVADLVRNDTDGIHSLLGAIRHVQPTELLSPLTQPAESSAAAASTWYSGGASTNDWNEIWESEANNVSSTTSRTANASTVPCTTIQLSASEARDESGESFLGLCGKKTF